LGAALAVGVFFVYLALSLGTPICFDDCWGYLALMGKHGAEYRDTFASMYRPWAVPVFYALFGTFDTLTAQHLVVAQTGLAFGAWGLLAAVALRGFERRTRALAFPVLLLMAFSQGYYVFNHYLLSDSLALTAAVVFASFVLGARELAAWCWRSPTRGLEPAFLATHAVLAALCLGTRDANLSVVLLGSGLVVVGCRKIVRPWQLAVLLLVVGCEVALSSDAGRHRRTDAMADLMAGAILPDPGMREFFAQRGMPPELVELGKTFQGWPLDAFDVAQGTRQKEQLSAVGSAYLPQAFPTYLAYLALHPGYLGTNLVKYRRLILDPFWGQDVFSSAQPPDVRHAIQPGDAVVTISSLGSTPRRIALADHVPLDLKLALMALYALAVAVLRARNPLAWAPVAFAVVGASNAAAGFFFCLWGRSEMIRHAFLGSVLFNVGFTLAVLVVAQTLPLPAFSLKPVVAGIQKFAHSLSRRTSR
jgi:hypothetical protein